MQLQKVKSKRHPWKSEMNASVQIRKAHTVKSDVNLVLFGMSGFFCEFFLNVVM